MTDGAGRVMDAGRGVPAADDMPAADRRSLLLDYVSLFASYRPEGGEVCAN